MHHGGAFVVGVPAVDVLIGHGRHRVEALVIEVGAFKYKQVIVFNSVDEAFSSVAGFIEKVGAVFGRTFFEPHVVVHNHGHHVTPPVMAKLVGNEFTVAIEVFIGHKRRVGDVFGYFKRPCGSVHVAHT